MDQTWLAPGGSYVGNSNSFGLEREYLRDTLWREETQSRQLTEQLKRNREKLDKDGIDPESRKGLRKKINSLNKRLKRSQKSIKTISANLATLRPQNQFLAQNWAVESDYSRRLQAVQSQTILDLQTQIQQLSLAAQNPFSPGASIDSPVPNSPMYLWSPVQSEGCSPLYSPFYNTSFQPFNYISGQFFAPSPLRRYSVSVSPTDVLPLNVSNYPSPGLPPRNSLIPATSAQPLVIEAKQRTMSLPLTSYKAKERLAEASRSKGLSPYRNST